MTALFFNSKPARWNSQGPNPDEAVIDEMLGGSLGDVAGEDDELEPPDDEVPVDKRKWSMGDPTDGQCE